MALYTSLPGIQTDLRDGGLVLPSNSRSTRRVLVIAPVSTTVNVSLPADLADLDVTPKRVSGNADFEAFNLGRYSKSNPLARLWKQVYDAGVKEIFCIPLPGIDSRERYIALHTIYSVLEDNFTADCLVVGGGNPEGDTPWGVYTDTVIETRDYVTVKAAYLLGDYITKKAGGTPEGIKLNGLVDLSLSGKADYIATKTFDKEIVTKEVTAEVSLQGALGQSGDNKGKLRLPYPCLNGTLFVGRKATSEATEVTALPAASWEFDKEDNILTLDAAIVTDADDMLVITYDTFEYNYADQLASLCFEVSRKNNQLLGFMAPAPLKLEDTANLMKIKQYIDKHSKVEYNAYLQVVAGPTLLFEVNNEPYEDIWIGAYAGMVAFLPSQSATTSKSIPGYLSASYNLSTTQVLNLVNKHFVVPRLKKGKLVVADGITTAKDNSDFIRLSTIRIVNEAVEMARNEADAYIGEPNSLPRRNSLETAINTGLKGMIQIGALNDGRAFVNASVNDEIDGTMRIALELVPAFETRVISFSISLKPSINRE